MSRLSEFKRYVRSRYMPRFARAELSAFLKAARGGDDPEDADDGAGGSYLFYDALDRAEAGPVSLVLGDVDDEDDEVRPSYVR